MVGGLIAVPMGLAGLYSDAIRSRLDLILISADIWHFILAGVCLALAIVLLILVGNLINLVEKIEGLQSRLNIDSKSGLASYESLKEKFVSDYLPKVAQGEHFSVLMFDLKDFKLINNKFGHTSGDEIISSVGGFLRQTVRGEKDMPVRYGEAADEFFVIVKGNSGALAGFGARLKSDLKEISSSSFPYLSQSRMGLDFWACGTEIHPKDTWEQILSRLSKRIGQNKVDRTDEISVVQREEADALDGK